MLRLLVLSCFLLHSAWAQSSTVVGYIAIESPIAKAGLLANIGPDGSLSSGAKSGVVIASPFTSNPDYLYTWTRDSSLVFKLIIDQYTLGLDTTVRSHIDNFVEAETIIQQITNPSGTVSTGGLGEPKFNINETAFTGAWGRPQRDGPALRSTALITWANYLLDEGNTSYVTDTLWPIIKLDLDYVAEYWNETTYDLWEEVDSSSFFTTGVQQRTLRQGATLASTLGEDASNYSTQADNVLCFQQTYWNTAGYMTANTGGGRSGKDANTVLTSIHLFDVDAGCDSITFQPCSDLALSNLVYYIDAFRSIYTINDGLGSTAAVATGRYPEDVYYDGNPWYLTTLAVAEQLYDSLIVWDKQGYLNVTSFSLVFFQTFDDSIEEGVYESGSITFTNLTNAISEWADAFVAIVAEYTPSSGNLSEQYSKTNGSQVSAEDLTWSYAAALTAFSARDGVTPATWGASGLTVASSCVRAINTAAVTFNVYATTVWGENIYIVGSVSELADWDTDNALILSADDYPTWSITVNLPASTYIEYKYIRIYDGDVTWESDPNMNITTPASGTYTENDTWR
ncbi:glucoamylase [Fistulina hepatica ATCC 64428]|uniref:glucan 1,4-alpha-glucosidase n=1 Tax=Fistulina hepatica ATCC 64428 TaxID=1128425 RepID=A0A0D7AQG8_9AGAR|nr:glucoamylase [Fistulina hepatica ATCC 64428]